MVFQTGFQSFLDIIRLETFPAFEAGTVTACAVKFKDAPAASVLVQAVNILRDDRDDFPRGFQARQSYMSSLGLAPFISW